MPQGWRALEFITRNAFYRPFFLLFLPAGE
jgi:hypothetical protein